MDIETFSNEKFPIEIDLGKPAIQHKRVTVKIHKNGIESSMGSIAFDKVVALCYGFEKAMEQPWQVVER